MDPQIKTSFLNQVDGSSSWVLSKTSVVASVTGPIEAKSRDEIPTAAAIDLVVRPAIGTTSTREHVIEEKLQIAFSSVIIRTLFPRMLIQIVAQIIEAGESAEFNSLELAATINATTLALIDAGIPLLGLVCASSFAIVDTTPPAEGSKQSNSDYSYYHQTLRALQENKTHFNSPSSKASRKEQQQKIQKLAAEKSINIPEKSYTTCVPLANADGTPSPKILIINPSDQDLKHADSWHTVAYEFKESAPSRLLLVDSKGKFKKHELYKVLEVAASTGCQDAYVSMVLAVDEKLQKDFVWRA